MTPEAAVSTQLWLPDAQGPYSFPLYSYQTFSHESAHVAYAAVPPAPQALLSQHPLWSFAAVSTPAQPPVGWPQPPGSPEFELPHALRMMIAKLAKAAVTTFVPIDVLPMKRILQEPGFADFSGKPCRVSAYGSDG
jgi:hypothetical protein